MSKLKEYADWLGLVVTVVGAGLSIINIVIGEQGFLAQIIAITFLAIGIMVLIYTVSEKKRSSLFNVKGQAVKTPFPRMGKFGLFSIPVLWLAVLLWQYNSSVNIVSVQPTNETMVVSSIATPQSLVTPTLTATDGQIQPTQCREFRVVFLIDQSRSMFGFIDENGKTIPASDRLGMRYYSLIYAINLMGDYHLTVSQDDIFRVAIVYFGTSTEIVTPWTIISPRTRDEWDKTSTGIKSQIPDIEKSKSMGETLFLPAFQMANLLLQQNNIQDLNCLISNQVILITDGKPKSNDISAFDWQDHMKNLAIYVENNLRPLNANIYVLGIDDTDSYWQDMWSYWVIVTNSNKQVIRFSPPSPNDENTRSLNDMGKVIQDIFHAMTDYPRELP